MDFFIRKRFIFSLGTIFVVILVTSFFAIDTLRLQKYDGIRINLSGRERMLSQKMTKEILLYNLGVVSEDAVLSTVRVFDTTLIALKDGGDAPLDLSMTEFEAIPEMENKEIKEQLEEVMTSWSTFKQKIESVLENNDASSVNYIIDNNTELLDEMDAAVVMMQHNAEERIPRFYWLIALGILLSVLILIVAITKAARRKYVKQLEQANIRLQEIDRLKSIFLASMSHELRTPLNSIIGFTGILLQGISGALGDEQKKQLTMVKVSGQHLLDLINDLLDVSKIEAGKAEVSVEEFALADVANEVTEAISPAANKKELDVVKEVQDEIVLLSDRRRVKQVLTNLVSNAVKFTDHGQVTITGKQLENKQVGFEVSDTGIGMKEKDMKRLFQPFQQIDESLTKKQEGTGLGLYLCKKIVDLLHGEIRAESEYGTGSTFTVTLPLRHRSEKRRVSEEDPGS